MYSHLLSPLSKLDGLHQFFVHFDLPYPRTAPEAPLEVPKYRIRPGYLAQGADHERKVEIERRLEQLVMEDDYSSATAGKEKLGRSQWFDVLNDLHTVQ